MGLQALGRETAHHKAVHGNIGERTVCHGSAVTSLYVIQSRAAEVLEATLFKTDILRMSDFYSRIGTSQPALIVEFVVVGSVNLRAKLVGLNEIHASLQRDMTFFRRSHPRGMAERDTFYGDVAHRMICCANHLDKRLKNGISSM